MSDETVAVAARAAAAELAVQLGQPALEVEVEVALYASVSASGEEGRPGRFVDPVAFAGLVVALTQFAYQVYVDQRKRHGHRPSLESVTREVRIRRQEGLQENEQDPNVQQRVLDVVIREIVKAADAEDDE